MLSEPDIPPRVNAVWALNLRQEDRTFRNPMEEGNF